MISRVFVLTSLLLLSGCIVFPSKLTEDPDRPPKPPKNYTLGISILQQGYFDSELKEDVKTYTSLKGESSLNFGVEINFYEVKSPKSIFFFTFGMFQVPDKEKNYLLTAETLAFGFRYIAYEFTENFKFTPGIGLQGGNINALEIPGFKEYRHTFISLDARLGFMWQPNPQLPIINFEFFRIEGTGFSSNGSRVGMLKFF